ncbi:hypothetical protein RYZ26_15955 [Terasakiella sp. A23]|uniref:hypothetical protein n=1 Tax=Terasakiella sp. FCG-A23 TaxID=3080561 RepID=UPI002953C8C3|nr:hypothetical protein [Terasakiella sp. A23]MDV7341102.1 hypothetical protein [Terasakiella sp. A23]
MAYKKRVPKTISHTKYVCSDCGNPVDMQSTKCPSCKTDVTHAPPYRLVLNLIALVAFGVFAYYTMN